VELAAAFGTGKPGRLIVAAISAVFTIGYVANLLGEDEDWLLELSIDMFPEDGRLWVYGVGEDGVTAFTEDGIENLRRSSSMNEPPAVRRHRSNPPSSPASAVLTAWKRSSGGGDFSEPTRPRARFGASLPSLGHLRWLAGARSGVARTICEGGPFGLPARAKNEPGGP